MADCMLKRLLGRTNGVQHASWPTVVANRIDFAHRHPRVRHHRPRIALRRGQEEGGECETVFADYHEAVARTDSEARKDDTDLCNDGGKPRVTPNGRAFHQCWMMRGRASVRPQEVTEPLRKPRENLLGGLVDAH